MRDVLGEPRGVRWDRHRRVRVRVAQRRHGLLGLGVEAGQHVGQRLVLAHGRVDRDLVLYAASVVSEYLDERYPHPPLMPVDPLSRARLRLAMLRVELEWVPQVQAIQGGTRIQAEAARKRLKEQLLGALPLFKAARFFLNPEMSLADCAVAPIVYRLPALGIVLPKEAKLIEDYGQRIFRNPGFLRSLTPEEKLLREIPA